jgi:Holliday junction resolvase RusA-like endonuclease
LVRSVASEHCEQPIEDEVSVEIAAYMKGKRVPDIDNIAKSICDGLQPVAFENDKQVKHLEITLHSVTDKSEERAEITIEKWEV